ncbi:kinase-like domain-containing protein [Halteromyces radiatus]|uniref:kinase-like domain-containing protein n=1 Tax=Halteromyces radiatus TaxID=101107 RepID=UPI002221070E|nr:kinase-like domain-containing protein [Halteromyces radiatus]KAI8097482.1 kinase-like domain-containing protein [Halteromyces radiatus]
MKGTFAIIDKETLDSRIVAVKKYYKVYGNLVLQHYERERWAFQKLALSSETEARRQHIVYLLEAKTLDDAYCLTLPFYPHTLLEFTKQPWPRPLALATFRDLVQGVSYLHQHGIAHCDLSLSNILMDSPPHFNDNDISNHRPLVIISDFGCAHPLVPYYQPAKQLHGADIGTRQFKAPEHLFGSSCYTAATDIWSLGVMYASLLLGRLLYPSQGDLEQVGMIVKSLGRPSKQVMQQEMINYPDTNKLWFFGHDDSDISEEEDDDDDDDDDDMVESDEEDNESFLLADVLTKGKVSKDDQELLSKLLTWSVLERASIQQILNSLNG